MILINNNGLVVFIDRIHILWKSKIFVKIQRKSEMKSIGTLCSCWLLGCHLLHASHILHTPLSNSSRLNREIVQGFVGLVKDLVHRPTENK